MDTIVKPRLDELASPRRNHFFYGKLLDELHLRMEQEYFNGKRRMLNRLALGRGVLCGLEVTSDGKHVWVSPGVAIDAYGREIVVPQKVLIDPSKITAEGGTVRDRDPNKSPVYLVLCYRECTADFVPALVTDCKPQDQCAPSTIVESYYLEVRADNPPAVSPPSTELCEAFNAGTDAEDKRKRLCEVLTKSPCATVSGDACVVLATIEVARDGTVADPPVMNTRDQVCSNELLLELLLCLRGAKGDTGLAKIAFINWPHNQTLTLRDMLVWQSNKVGPTVTFTGKVSALPSDGAGWMSVSVEYQVPTLGWLVPCYVRAHEIRLNELGTTATFVLPPEFYALFFVVMKQLKQQKALVRVQVRCDHLRAGGQLVDGNFHHAKTNKTDDGYEVVTGDGVPGGTFESWFYLSPPTARQGAEILRRTSVPPEELLRSVFYFLPTKKG